MMQADEHSLVQKIARGDAQALQMLYTSYRPLLWRYLWQQLDRNEQSVEDALQEIFLSIWRSAPGFRGDAQVKTWIFRIGHNYLAHCRRDGARRPEGHAELFGGMDDTESEGDDFPAGDTSIFQVSHEDEVIDRLALAAAIDRLSTKHREALELVFQQGFTLEESAEILGVPAGTVKSRISYARRALQRELACQETAEEHSS
jgi:RNA polymerase sigma-70 factor (ECF subfamily)